MPRRQYNKALATFEHGTKVYAPTDSDPRFTVIAKDASGRRTNVKVATESSARAQARLFEAMRAGEVVLPGRAGAPTTVGGLIDRYLASLTSKSTRYIERQQYLLDRWARPLLGELPLNAWTAANSEQVLDHARTSLAPATVQNLGSALRALVTFAFKNRWLPREADPMWLVRYTPRPEHHGEAAGFVKRAALPTDEQCDHLFAAMVEQGHPGWALAMRLKSRSGLRWGELIALRPVDLTFAPTRSVTVTRAIEQSRQGFAVKSTKNRQRRETVFPASLHGDLHAWVDARCEAAGPEGLLFTGPDGEFANRRTVQRFWSLAARTAGWPMRSDTSSVWHPHHLRHVAACWMLFDVRMDPAAVSAMLGHATVAFTLSRYVGVRGDLAVTATAATERW